ncbi:hypothetical protein JOF34_001042 [Microbacterium amylolyticum]|uniref:Uncharacterized protein n=1 Tax=Microbacterium amylolyticum TaxID=936337 RepID=A0ABS4ZIZ3_9MICO|nr:hypothetical protein [Microbacterium amylolyticum]
MSAHAVDSAGALLGAVFAAPSLGPLRITIDSEAVGLRCSRRASVRGTKISPVTANATRKCAETIVFGRLTARRAETAADKAHDTRVSAGTSGGVSDWHLGALADF